MSFILPELPYSYDALAPYMSRETLEYHHDKHHLAYVNNANNLIKGTEFEGKSLEDIVKGSFGKNVAFFNNAGQHYNHIHFWKWMKAGGGADKIPGNLEKKIVSDLGSVAKMKDDFIQAGITQFGSGWRSRTERSSWRTPQMVKAHWCKARSLFSDVTFGNIPTTSIIATGDPIISKPLATILSTGIMSLRCSLLLHQNSDPQFNTVWHDFEER